MSNFIVKSFQKILCTEPIISGVAIRQYGQIASLYAMRPYYSIKKVLLRFIKIKLVGGIGLARHRGANSDI